MNDDYFTRSQTGARPRKGTMRPVLIAVAGAFALGAGAMGWFGYEHGMELPLIGGRSDATSVAPALPVDALPTPTAVATGHEVAVQAAEEAHQAAEKVAQVAQQTGGLDQRLAGLEQRIANLDLQLQASTGNAARAEGLLIAFSARRRIDRGDPLGYLEDQLRLRFGDARPNAVEAIITAAENPVTLDQLMARLEGLAPRLATPTIEQEGWGWFSRELSELFVVRKEATPSPRPERRLERARLFLESGRIDAAIAEVQNMPGAQEADKWVADARRYANAQRALDLLETTAVLEPRELRDGSGKKVSQPSPADAPTPAASATPAAAQ